MAVFSKVSTENWHLHIADVRLHEGVFQLEKIPVGNLKALEEPSINALSQNREHVNYGQNAKRMSYPHFSARVVNPTGLSNFPLGSRIMSQVVFKVISRVIMLLSVGEMTISTTIICVWSDRSYEQKRGNFVFYGCFPRNRLI